MLCNQWNMESGASMSADSALGEPGGQVITRSPPWRKCQYSLRGNVRTEVYTIPRKSKSNICSYWFWSMLWDFFKMEGRHRCHFPPSPPSINTEPSMEDWATLTLATQLTAVCHTHEFSRGLSYSHPTRLGPRIRANFVKVTHALCSLLVYGGQLQCPAIILSHAGTISEFYAQEKRLREFSDSIKHNTIYIIEFLEGRMKEKGTKIIRNSNSWRLP